MSIAYVFLSLGSIVFVLLFWVQLHVRFAHDHGTYRYLGVRVRAIRRSWEVDPFFTSAAARQPLGAGPGYKMTTSNSNGCDFHASGCCIWPCYPPRSLRTKRCSLTIHSTGPPPAAGEFKRWLTKDVP